MGSFNLAEKGINTIQWLDLKLDKFKLEITCKFFNSQ